MALIVRDREGNLLSNSSDYKILAKDYIGVSEGMDRLKGELLIEMKSKVAHGDVSKLWESIGMSNSSVSRYIKLHTDNLELKSAGTGEFELPETVSQHSELQGNTAQERQEHFEAVVEASGESQPSSRTIKNYTVDNTDTVEAIDARNAYQTKKTALNSAHDQLGYSKTEIAENNPIYEASELFHNLMDYQPEWETCRSDLLRMAHPDTGGSNEAIGILNLLNETFQAFKLEDRKAFKREEIKDLTKKILKDNK